MPGCARTVTETVLARWTATARSSRRIPGDVAKTFSSTKMIDKVAAKFGRKVFESPIGFKYICELMLERDILLGGEESGGIGTKLYLPERDATVMADWKSTRLN